MPNSRLHDIRPRLFCFKGAVIERRRFYEETLVLVVGLSMLCSSQPSLAADVGFDMNINIGNGGGRVAVPVQEVAGNEVCH